MTACVCDPPYDFDASGGGIMRKNRDYVDKIEDYRLTDGFDDAMLSPRLFAAVAVFAHDNQCPELWTRLRARYHRAVLCSWRKTNPMPVANRAYVPETELYLHAWGSAAPPRGDLRTLRRVFEGPVGKSEYDHPTVKPLRLMRKIVVNVGLPVIVDPFMGTGTTGVAALLEGRRFIGVETERRWFEIAVRRIAEAASQAAFL